MKNLNKKTSLSVVLAIIMFTYIFSPPLLPINMHVLVEVISVIYIIIVVIKNRGHIIINKGIVSLGMAFVPFFIYESIMLFVFINNNGVYRNEYIGSYGLVIRIWMRIFIVCVGYYFFIVNNGFSLQEQLKVYVIVIEIQLFFVILSLLVPNVRDAIFNMISTNSSQQVIVDVIGRLGNRRGYGLAENLFDAFGFIISLLLSMVYATWLETEKKRYIILVAFLLIACILNARTGVILSLIAIACATIGYKKSTKQVRKMLFICVCIPFIALLIIRIIGSVLPETITWLEEGFKEVLNLIKFGEYTGTFGGLHNDTFWPKDLFFGMGAEPEVLANRSSDVGYVQCVWRYGVIGTILLMGGYFYGLFRGGKSIKNRGCKVLMLVFAVVLIIYLFKIYFINNLGANFIIYSCIIGIMNEKQRISCSRNIKNY